MGVTSYYTVNGEIIGENGPNGRIDYQVDALGSVVGTMNSSGSAQKVYRYKPFGAVLNDSGPGAEPMFRWVGALGYRYSGLAQSDQYFRACHYGSSQGQWTTVDPTWPQEPPYARRDVITQSGGTTTDYPCCCTNALNKSTISGPVTQDNIYGNQITISGTMTQAVAAPVKAGTCGIAWWEKCSEITTTIPKADTWTLITPASMYFKGKVPPCPPGGSSPWSMPDLPGVPLFRFIDTPAFTWTLCIKIFISTTPCPPLWPFVSFSQIITWDPTKGKKNAQAVQGFGLAHTYCSDGAPKTPSG